MTLKLVEFLALFAVMKAT